MKRQDFNFHLPEALIAQYPLANRSDSRLLVYQMDKTNYLHHTFKDIVNFIEPGDLLVMNNTKVIPARFFGVKESGGKVEGLVERIYPDNTFLAHIKASKSLKPGALIILSGGYEIKVLSKEGDLYHCMLPIDVETMLDDIGEIPLPLYIHRKAELADETRYQTVYALHKGSVAAPTAGLHFDDLLMNQLKDKGVNIAYTTLHIGAGTFKPVRSEMLSEHVMHAEWCVVDEALCAAVNNTRKAGKRVIAVGTTAVRSLETAGKSGQLVPYEGDTSIFIYPGYTFNICDGILTNFHLPESTLLMLVAAFIGHQEAMALYEEAIAKTYRFFSYGDASLLLKGSCYG